MRKKQIDIAVATDKNYLSVLLLMKNQNAYNTKFTSGLFGVALWIAHAVVFFHCSVTTTLSRSIRAMIIIHYFAIDDDDDNLEFRQR